MNMVSPVKKTVILEKLKTSKETIYGHIVFYLLTSLKHVKIHMANGTLHIKMLLNTTNC